MLSPSNDKKRGSAVHSVPFAPKWKISCMPATPYISWQIWSLRWITCPTAAKDAGKWGLVTVVKVKRRECTWVCWSTGSQGWEPLDPGPKSRRPETLTVILPTGLPAAVEAERTRPGILNPPSDTGSLWTCKVPACLRDFTSPTGWNMRSGSSPGLQGPLQSHRTPFTKGLRLNQTGFTALQLPFWNPYWFQNKCLRHFTSGPDNLIAGSAMVCQDPVNYPFTHWYIVQVFGLTMTETNPAQRV